MYGDPAALETKGSWAFLRLAASLPAKHIQIVGLAANKLVYNGRCIAVGCALNNAATVGGVLTVYDGQDTNGENAGAYGFAASSALNPIFGVVGVHHEIGVFLSPSAGVLTGSLWVIPLSVYAFTPPGD